MDQENLAKVYSLSKSFKIFLGFFIIIALCFLGYILHKTGDTLDHIIPLLSGAGGGVFLIYWIMTTGVRKIYSLDNLSDTENLLVENINQLKITPYVKKYIFSDLDIQSAIRFIVVSGNHLKWLFFWIFAGGTIIVVSHKDTIFNITLISSLAIIWCPWIEQVIIRKVDYKIVFAGKILLTAIVFFIGVSVSP